ncbi:MAG: hypothetical protein HRU20_27285 [Pseudomonadales bacterium]|nr:hypothetical protein [Pseudomonadales bacterium]
MISESNLLELVKVKFPSWNINIRQSGVALWVNVNDGDSNYFEFQVTPSEGVGVSIIDSAKSDMSGHDEGFETVEKAVDYLLGLL